MSYRLILILVCACVLGGCRCGKEMAKDNIAVDSVAHREATTSIEVVPLKTDTEPKATVADAGKRTKQSKKKETTKQQPDNVGLLVDKLLQEGGGVIKITETQNATSTVDKQQKQLDKYIERRTNWIFYLGLVVAVAGGFLGGRRFRI